MSQKILEKHYWKIRMLEDKDRIFKNLYNDEGSDLSSAIKRGDWSKTKEICEKIKTT